MIGGDVRYSSVHAMILNAFSKHKFGLFLTAEPI